MARLQDFSNVTPSSSSDKLLIVQSAGQGLATLDTVGQQIANNTSVSQLNTTRKTLAGAINEHDSEIGTLSSLTTTDKSSLVGAVNEVNANKAEASDVYTQAQTDTLLDTKTNKSLCQEGTFTSNAPFTVWGVGNYATLIVIGMAQGVGSIALVVKVVNNALTVYDMLTGATFSNTNLTFAYNSTNKYVNISSNQTSTSRVTVIKGGLT